MLIKQQKKENLSLLSKNKRYYIQNRPKHTVATKKKSQMITKMIVHPMHTDFTAPCSYLHARIPRVESVIEMV